MRGGGREVMRERARFYPPGSGRQRAAMRLSHSPLFSFLSRRSKEWRSRCGAGDEAVKIGAVEEAQTQTKTAPAGERENKLYTAGRGSGARAESALALRRREIRAGGNGASTSKRHDHAACLRRMKGHAAATSSARSPAAGRDRRGSVSGGLVPPLPAVFRAAATFVYRTAASLC